jgi:hypothetical protein
LLPHVSLLPVQRHPAAGGNRKRTITAVERVCENCAGEDDELIAVHRLYVVPESWDNPGSTTRIEETELWCFSCRSLYPHEPVEASEGP